MLSDGFSLRPDFFTAIAQSHVEVALPHCRRSPRSGPLPRSSGGLGPAWLTWLLSIAVALGLMAGMISLLRRRSPR
jgi:hypothetical protein